MRATILVMANWLSKTCLLTVDGATLTKARLRKRLGQDDVAARLGGETSKSSVSRWETGAMQPSMERLFKLVEILGTDNFIRLNGKAVLTAEEIEVVRNLREG